jgi:catechol 2,3-dioxygenase-like lactoylglutathione lyase family enzyme
MAYRFLLEVPESLAAGAQVTIDGTGDAQVLVARSSHGLGYDQLYMDLTVAAHTLRVIDAIYDWFDGLGASRPDIRLVLHGGDRLPLEAYDRGAMVAAIRRDQPWVERSIPKIGEHEPEGYDTELAGVERERVAGGLVERVAPSGSLVVPYVGEEGGPTAGHRVHIRAVNHLSSRVIDLARAERFYTDFFGMELLGRARRDGRGRAEPLNGDYRWDEAVRTGAQADVTYLRNGPLTLALERVGLGVRMERFSVLDRISLAVDGTTFTRLKGEILMRAYETLAVGETSIVFRDPFSVPWELTVGAGL